MFQKNSVRVCEGFHHYDSCMVQRLGLKWQTDSDGPNLCRVKKVDVSSTFIEKIEKKFFFELLKTTR